MKAKTETLTDVFGRPIRKSGVKSPKQKGNANERKVCAMLKQWTGLEFMRVPNSGALRWKAKVDAVAGDVICESDFPFVVETKHLKELHLQGGVMPVRAKILTIWKEQAFPDACRAGKLPMALLKANGMRDHFLLLHKDYGGRYLSVLVKPRAISLETEVYIFSFKSVVATVSWARFEAAIKKGSFVDHFTKRFKLGL